MQLQQISYADIGSNERLTYKSPVNFPAISISIRSEADQVKSLRNPPSLPHSYKFGRVDTLLTPPHSVNAPSEDLRMLKYRDFSFYMLPNKSADQIIQFLKLKALEMELSEKKSFQILDTQFQNYEVDGEDPASSMMQIFLNKYFASTPSLSNSKTNSAKKIIKSTGVQTTINDKPIASNQIKIKIPSAYHKPQELHQEQIGFMKIPLGLSSHISESNRFNRIRGLNFNENQLIMCNICCEEWFYSQFFRISKQCTHIFCIKCAQSYIITKIQCSEVFCIKCPQEDCNVYYYDHEIFIAINQDNYYVRKFLTLKKLKILNSNPRTRWCINQKCNNYIKVEQESALTFAAPDSTKKGPDSFKECDVCKQRFCSICCYPAHTGLTCEDNLMELLLALKKNRMTMKCDTITNFIDKTCRLLLKTILYLLLYIIYLIVCIPISFYYPHYLFSKFQRNQKKNQNSFFKALAWLFLFMLSLLIYPFTFMMLITIGVKIYFLPRAKDLLSTKPKS